MRWTSCGKKGNVVIHQFVEVLQPFYVQGRQIPALLERSAVIDITASASGGPRAGPS